MIDQEHCEAHRLALGDDNDCVVRACAVALQIDYPAMHEYMAAHGRKQGWGMSPRVYLPAIEDLGVTLTRLQGPLYRVHEVYVDETQRYTKHGWVFVPGHYRQVRRKARNGKDYSAATVTTLARELTAGTYLVTTPGHVLCLRDGVVHDWTDGRRNRIEAVHRVEY